MNLRTLNEAKVSGKKVILRVAFDVPLARGKVTDNFRIKAALPTIQYLLEKKTKIILVSYLGRPGGKVVKEMKLDPVAAELSKLIGKKVAKLNDCIGPKVEQFVSKMKEGDIVLLENTRFHPEEDLNDPEFAKKLAKVGNLFVNDAFAQSHRNCASIAGISKILPSFAGFSLEKEVGVLEKIMKNPSKPFVFVLGGAKLTDKIPLLENLLDKIDILIIGGAMAATFLKAEGYEVGQSFVDDDLLNEAEDILRKAEDRGVEVFLPDEVMVAGKIADGIKPSSCDIINIDKADIIVDVGESMIQKIAQPLKFAGTIFWNGPLGVAEYSNFSKQSESLAKLISEIDAFKVAGGGDTIAFIEKMELGDKFDYLLVGGGASLEFLAGKKLPGITALLK